MRTRIRTTATGEHLVTTRQLAAHLQVHEETVRNWVRQKRISGLKIGRTWRIDPEEIQKIKRNGGV